MPISRKRALQEADTSNNAQPPKEPSVLHRIRNMWQFANLFQFILLFGKALKLDDSLDIEVWQEIQHIGRCSELTCSLRQDLEAECLKPGSMVLQDIGLGILKFLSSHRGLTYVDGISTLRYLSHRVCLQTKLATTCSKNTPEDSFSPKLLKRTLSELRICLPSLPTSTSLQRYEIVYNDSSQDTTLLAVQDDTNDGLSLDPCTPADEPACHVYPRATSREDRGAKRYGPDQLGAQSSLSRQALFC